MSSVPSAPPRPWLFGPVRDLAFGCGAFYLLVFAAMALAGGAVRSLVPAGSTFLLITFVSLPHYGATLLRVYDRAEDRRRYRLFALWTTLALVALFVWGLSDVAAGSWLATLYLTWSPWHYAGQNFGVGMMFLRRRGVDVPPLARTLLWWSFALSFALTFLALHGADSSARYAPADFAETVLTFRPLGIPAGVERGATIVVAIAYVGVTAGAFVLLARRTSWRNLVPAATLVATQALWFTVPTLARMSGALGGVDPLADDHAAYVFVWIASAHAAQYLWITTYYAVQTGGARRHAGFFAKSLVAGAAVWTIPALVFAPNLLGRLPYDAGLALLVASVVNLHHFVLDGVLWKLRDGRIAQILLGGADAPAPAPAPATRGPNLRPVLAVAGTACLAVVLYAGFQSELGFRSALARDDLTAAGASAARLARIGRDGAEMHFAIARRAEETGDTPAARTHYDAAIRLRPTAWSYIGLGRTYARDAQWTPARDAFDHALALEPSHAVALLYAGIVDLETGRPDAGRAKLESAREAAQDPSVQREIADVMARYGVGGAALPGEGKGPSGK